MKPIISAKNLNFTYNKGKDNEFQALINVNLDIYPEEFIIIFGPSGCGKSTLVNVIGGLEVPDSGSVFVFEKDLLTMNKKEYANYHRSQVGMIYQAYNLITSLTVLDNVALPQIFLNVKKGKRDKWSRTLLERFGILKQANKVPTELSGGQQQRIGIARAIVNNPQIVLADEPVGNLDSVSAKNVLEILSELNEKEKKTIIMVTHNPEHLPYGDRIIHMKDGLITGETINRDKHLPPGKEREVQQKPPTAEIQDLMRAYHGLSPEQINILIMPYKAKVFSHHFISSRNMEETKTLEDVIQRRLLGTISLEEFFDILNRPADEGGVGFDIRSAEKVIRRVNRVIRMAYFIYQKGHQRQNEEGGHEKITEEEKVERMTMYLLKTCYTDFYEHLDEVQINRLKKSVNDRLSGVMHKSEFYNFLDLPFKEGGVGLNSKTARAITEEIELVLILGFGIVQRHPGPSHLASMIGGFGQDVGNAPLGSEPFSAQAKAPAVGSAAGVAAETAAEPAAEPAAEKNSLAEKKEEVLEALADVNDNNANIKEKSGEEPIPKPAETASEAKVSSIADLMGVSDDDLQTIIGREADRIPDVSMKDFAAVVKNVAPQVHDKVTDERLAEAVKKALIERR
ncbi:MAG: ABC transporter ATP-binding protein [Planctomycetes bacterium]|jgi:putative ABC transport system ATP-binding protein|nr:ABC transporter ATP-binding protein [Planctomycetota bacterium]